MKSPLAATFQMELRGSIREFSGVLFGILLPVGLILLLGALYGNSLAQGYTGVSKLQLAVPSVFSIGICATGLMGLPLGIAAYREKRILRMFLASPSSPQLLLFSHFGVNLLQALVSSALVLGIAMLIFGYTLQGNILALMFCYLLTLTAIYALGMCIASVAPTYKSATLMATAAYFPMFFLSGGTIPYEIMPKGLQMVANILPMTQGVLLLKAASLGEPLHGHMAQMLYLAALAIIGIAVSIKTFQYEYR